MIEEYIGKIFSLYIRKYSEIQYEVFCYGNGYLLCSRGFKSKERALVFFEQKIAEVMALETWWSYCE